MSIFAVFAPEKPAVLAARIRAVFPEDHLTVSANSWLIADGGTSQSVCEKIGLGDDKSLGGAVVVSVSGYYGFAGPMVWEWIKAKWLRAALGRNRTRSQPRFRRRHHP